MSEMTRCNYCTLKRLRAEAKKAGKPPIVAKNGTGNWIGWKVLYQGDKPIEHYMKEITDHCIC